MTTEHDDPDLWAIDTVSRRKEPEKRFIRFVDYGENFPILPTDAFVEVFNPRDADASAEIFIGPPTAGAEGIHVRLERMRPREDQLSPEEISKRIKTMFPVRLEYLRVLLTVPAQGHVKIPRSWLRGLRRIDPERGCVVGGLIPWLQVVGRENPPLAPALLNEPVVTPFPTAPRAVTKEKKS